jgi:hypothetical protein
MNNEDSRDCLRGYVYYTLAVVAVVVLTVATQVAVPALFGHIAAH